jgi:hypothetical protein
MKKTLHITSGDCAGDLLKQSGLPGEVFVWHDILYEGPRNPGWPDEEILQARAKFLEGFAGGALNRQKVFEMLKRQYRRLEEGGLENQIVLWFDACVFDQAMLVHLLSCLHRCHAPSVELLCIDAFPGVEPYDGLGQLRPEQLASCFDRRQPVTEEQFIFAAAADHAFALQDRTALTELAGTQAAPLPWVPAATERRLQEFPDPITGLGRLEILALAAIHSGCKTPSEILAYVARHDTHPRFWGDTTLWVRLNALAGRNPPKVRIEGPTPFLPQWEGIGDLALFHIYEV